MAASDDVWDRFIELGHDGTGPIVPKESYDLYVGLRDRGLTFTAEAGDHTPILVVSPPEALTDEDCAFIRRWKWHLLMLMDFEGRPGLDAHLLISDDARQTSAAKAVVIVVALPVGDSAIPWNVSAMSPPTAVSSQKWAVVTNNTRRRAVGEHARSREVAGLDSWPQAPS